MSEKRRDFLVNLAVGAITAGLVYWLDTGRGYPFLHCLCDGFFVAAVMLLGVGTIRAVRNRGAFDVVGFGVGYVLRNTFPFLGGDGKESLEEYRQRKTSARRGAGGLLKAGTLYLALSVAALVLYLAGRG